MTIAKLRTPLTRLLTASALSLALLGGITACASNDNTPQPQAGNSVAPTTAAPTTTAPADPSIPDADGLLHGFVTKVVSTQVVEFTPILEEDMAKLTGKEPSFLVRMDLPKGWTDLSTCDEAKVVKVMEDNLSKFWLSYRDANADKLNDKGQRQGSVYVVQGPNFLDEALRLSSCQPS